MEIPIPSHIPPHLSACVRTYISGQRIETILPDEKVVSSKTKSALNAKIIECALEKIHNAFFTAVDLYEASNKQVSYKTAYNHLLVLEKLGRVRHQKTGGRHFFAKNTPQTEAQS